MPSGHITLRQLTLAVVERKLPWNIENDKAAKINPKSSYIQYLIEHRRQYERLHINRNC